METGQLHHDKDLVSIRSKTIPEFVRGGLDVGAQLPSSHKKSKTHTRLGQPGNQDSVYPPQTNLISIPALKRKNPITKSK
ncbi:hypothetical protein AMTR_s00180p00046480 [Amborella trichopoda]|uniref:Uncharacterized protein n=1 Tax=Amborella trichopoda TaxID=13333 RepID=W1PXU3_AMBTC|nr:hypothetical protein AMTR_s00180p00046480 [Amborella trichopoda]